MKSHNLNTADLTIVHMTLAATMIYSAEMSLKLTMESRELEHRQMIEYISHDCLPARPPTSSGTLTNQRSSLIYLNEPMQSSKHSA